MLIPKWFIAATEGKTVEHPPRLITAQQIQEMAEGYDPDVYRAPISYEHYFAGFGFISAAKAEKHPHPAFKGGMCLQIQIDANEDLIALAKSERKTGFSIEMDTNFLMSGKAGLVGCAVCNYPYSPGTSKLQFSRTESRTVNPKHWLTNYVDNAWEPELFAQAPEMIQNAGSLIINPSEAGTLRKFFSFFGWGKLADSAPLVSPSPSSLPTEDFAMTKEDIQVILEANNANLLQNFSQALDERVKVTVAGELTAHFAQVKETVEASTAPLKTAIESLAQTPVQSFAKTEVTGTSDSEKVHW